MVTCAGCGKEFTPAGPPPPVGAAVICPRCAASATVQASAPRFGSAAPQPARGNTLGIIGLICSVLGLFTIIFLLPGVILSLFGLRKEPRGTAIAGAVVGVAGVVLWGLLLAILIPSLARAKTLATKAFLMADERGIWQQCILYAQNHDAQFPPDMATLLATDKIQPINLVSPLDGRPPLVIPSGDATDVNWIRRHLSGHSDFVYVGKGMTSNAGAWDIVMYSRPHLRLMGTDMSIIFGDGHVAIVAAAKVPGVFARTNKVRQAEQLPPLPIPTP